MPRRYGQKPVTLLGLLFFASAATAGERCVNYVSGVHVYVPPFSEEKCKDDECVFASFNPRTRESVAVARIKSVPYGISWDKNFGVLTYGGTDGAYRLEWKSGAAPSRASGKDTGSFRPAGDPHQSVGRIWQANAQAPTPAFDAPAYRRIDVQQVELERDDHFAAPVIWKNTETGETKTLYEKDPLVYGNPGLLQISTADRFILIESESLGSGAVVADMNTGEVLLRAGGDSRSAGWGNCPAK